MGSPDREKLSLARRDSLVPCSEDDGQKEAEGGEDSDSSSSKEGMAWDWAHEAEDRQGLRYQEEGGTQGHSGP